MANKTIELLSPARDAQTAITAIQCGADAVYMGAAKFGAREAAANSIEAIRSVIEYAHPYYVKVYAAVNTLLYDEELSAARDLIGQLYDAGVDGLIIQDTGLLELELPSLPLIASTQMHNNTPEKIKFLEDVGFSRAILARELTLEQIRQIRQATSIELECFIHGALCVGQSGQCYMSYCLGGRSGNRGQCAQPCRRLYSVADMEGKLIVKDRYLLSLKDLNLSEHLGELLDAGICSFKIEGRLKDVSYVANVTGFYRQKLDALLPQKGLTKSSGGTAKLNYEPNPDKTFNRGYTDYGLAGHGKKMGSINTPKSIGEYIGKVTRTDKNTFWIDSSIILHNGDGICFFDAEKKLCGTSVNGVEGNRIRPQKMDEITEGVEIYRNYDHLFTKLFDQTPAVRKIAVEMIFRSVEDGFELAGKDEDGNTATFHKPAQKQPAEKKEAAQNTILTQLQKLGNTIFECQDIRLELDEIYFLPVSFLNEIKRGLVEKLLMVRQSNRPKATRCMASNAIPYPEKHLSYLGNVLNKKAEGFYRKHGVEVIESAAESGLDLTGRLVMKTRYCLRSELGLCEKSKSALAAPLLLTDEDERQFRVEFECSECGMKLYSV